MPSSQPLEFGFLKRGAPSPLRRRPTTPKAFKRSLQRSCIRGRAVRASWRGTPSPSPSWLGLLLWLYLGAE